ncbi:hypothetical protein RF55_22113 [Lasius niger]|uniref:DUF4817 domain-containing protein n=1 Tax=Lasius niger TaxID=67767 RepID=A0A0J7JWY1_LASNI|nr:hypothetical protein RF55_22113 [Lasius niger]
MVWSNNEMTDMHLMYGLAHGNAVRARLLYAETFPNRRLPERKMFQRIDERLRNMGSFKKQTANCGRPIRTRNIRLEEQVLNSVTQNPGTSTREIARAQGVGHMMVWKILREQLYPYHVQKVQGLSESDYPPREAFYEIPLNIIHRMWFMHDGAPPHFSREARRYLDERFPGRWIGRAGPIAWPARSPDLNPLDYYLWGHLKSIVYKTSIDNVEIFRQRVEDGCREIRAIPGIFEKVTIYDETC